MRRVGVLVWIAVVVLSGGNGRVALGQAGEDPARLKVELALHYDLYAIQQGHVHDASGKQHHGKLQQGEIIFGRNKPAVSFRAEGRIAMSELPETLNPVSRSFTVGALCRPQVADAVLLAMGDDTNGWSVANVTGSLIAHKPDGPFTVGAGGSVTVADAVPTTRWQGLLQDVRLYWGVLDRATFRNDWQEWADLVSCGCRG